VIAKVRAAGSEGALQLSETRVPPYGLTVRYGRAATAVLSQWEQRSRDRVLSALALVLAALVLAGLLLVHIGRLHRSELSLRASEQHFLTLFEQAPLPLALVRVDDEYMLEMNAAFRRQFGVGERPGGAPALAFWSSAQQHETYRQLLASSRQVAGLDVQLRRHDGCLLECQVSARLLHEDGVAVAIFCAVDLTHQHRIEHEIRELNAALEQRVQQRTLSLEQQHDELRRARDAAELAGRAKARLLAAASHDLRQPLHALSLYSGVLAAAPDAATLAAVGSHIRASVSALGALLNALLDLSKLDAGVYRIERCVLSLSDLLERVCNDYRAQAHDKGLQLRLECPPLLVMSDPVALERIVRNLIDNAVKYSSAGQVVVSAAAIDGRVLATVQDDGPGIAADEQARIFDEFYQIAGAGHEAGLGLGLSIVQRLAGLLDARLSLSSVPGAGAAFSWSMPHFQDVAQVPAAALEADLRGLRVLLVDDDGAILHSMALLLRSWGCSALCAADADAASALMAQHAGAVDVLVLDLRLPDGASGLQLAQQLQQRWGPRPVLLVSGETDGELLRQASASASKVLFKPVTPEVLRAHLGGLT
jgi:signal transduction histidine kinase/CheY-like chemotaxis protein